MDNNIMPAGSMPSAKTNLFDLKDEVDDLISKLLEPIRDGLYVTYKYKKFVKRDEKREHFEQRVHSDIKSIIRIDLSLPSTESVKYQTVKTYDDGCEIYYFFYLSTEPVLTTGLIAQLQNIALEKKQLLLAGLFRLHVKLDFIDLTKERFEFPVSFFNSELYVAIKLSGKEKIDGTAYLETLLPNFYVSPTNELLLNVTKKVIKTLRDDAISTNTEETPLLFKHKSSQYRATAEVSATKYSKRKFMVFGDGYVDCINYTQNLLVDIVKGLLNRLDILHESRCFRATQVIDHFIHVENKITSDLVIINNINSKDITPEISTLIKQIMLRFEDNNVQMQSERPKLGDLDLDKNYLVLNIKDSEDGNSLFFKNEQTDPDKKTKIPKHFWDAYRFVPREQRHLLDYYSQLKIERFEKQGTCVIQGLDLFQKLKSSHLPHLLNKIESELWLKNSVLKNAYISDIDLSDGLFTLLYVRKLFGKKNNFFASVLEVALLNGNLTIVTSKVIKSEKRLQMQCKFLGNRKIFNDSFYLFDKHSETLLVSYTSPRLPLIIGNVEVDNIAIAESDDAIINRRSAFDKSVLPYYVMPSARKQYHHIYLQERYPDLLYFVAAKNKPNATIDKQNRIYNLLTFDSKGNLLKALEQPVTKLFFNSFTNDILRVNEVSKSSLLETIAKLYIEN